MKDLDAVQVEQLKQIADYLREERQKQAVSLEEIALKTYIPLRLLQALEAGIVERLPEPVFIQGFIRRYADALGVDGWTLAKTFSVESPTTEPKPSPPEVARSVAPVESPAGRSNQSLRVPPLQIPLASSPTKPAIAKFALPVGVGLVLLFAVGSIIVAINRSQPNTNTTRQPGATGEKTAATTTVDATSSSAPTSTSATTSPIAQPSVSPAPIAASPSPSVSPLDEAANSASPVSVAINLKNGDSWMEVIVDGKSEFQGVLKKGEQRRWSGKSKIELISGNAGAVYISYNNSAEKLLGDLGAVKTVTFPTEETTVPTTTGTSAN